jgi:2-iminoacetate synthase ThiH
MSRRPATFTQADIARAIRAAKQAGAAEVVVQVGADTRIVVRINSTGDQAAPLAPADEIVL